MEPHDVVAELWARIRTRDWEGLRLRLADDFSVEWPDTRVTIFPVITGKNGSDAIFRGAADFDLELIESRTLDGSIQEFTYRPTLHVHA